MFLYDEDNFIYKTGMANLKLIKTIEFLEFKAKGKLFDFVRGFKNDIHLK